MDLNRGNSLSMFCASLLSIIGSLSTMIVLLFPDLRIKPVIRVALFINISNLLTACGSIVGEPLDRTIECYYEGIITNIFTLSSIFWCGIVSFMLYTIVVLSEPYKINYRTHLFCWLLPILLTFLPFINSTYGAPGDQDYGWCFISSIKTTPKWSVLFWVWFSFYGWVWIIIVFIIILFTLTVQQIKDMVLQKNKLPLIMAYQKLEYYPVIIFICWFFPCLNDSFTYSPSNPDTKVYYNFASFAAIIPCLQGILTAIFFWLTNPEIIIRFKELHERIKSNEISNFRQFYNYYISNENKMYAKKSFGMSSSNIVVDNNDDDLNETKGNNNVKRKFRQLTIIENENNYLYQRKSSINSFSILYLYINELNKIEESKVKTLENIEENNDNNVEEK